MPIYRVGVFRKVHVAEYGYVYVEAGAYDKAISIAKSLNPDLLDRHGDDWESVWDGCEYIGPTQVDEYAIAESSRFHNQKEADKFGWTILTANDLPDTDPDPL